MCLRAIVHPLNMLRTKTVAASWWPRLQNKWSRSRRATQCSEILMESAVKAKAAKNGQRYSKKQKLDATRPAFTMTARPLLVHCKGTAKADMFVLNPKAFNTFRPPLYWLLCNILYTEATPCLKCRTKMAPGTSAAVATLLCLARSTSVAQLVALSNVVLPDY